MRLPSCEVARASWITGVNLTVEGGFKRNNKIGECPRRATRNAEPRRWTRRPATGPNFDVISDVGRTRFLGAGWPVRQNGTERQSYEPMARGQMARLPRKAVTSGIFAEAWVCKYRRARLQALHGAAKQDIAVAPILHGKHLDFGQIGGGDRTLKK